MVSKLVQHPQNLLYSGQYELKEQPERDKEEPVRITLFASNTIPRLSIWASHALAKGSNPGIENLINQTIKADGQSALYDISAITTVRSQERDPILIEWDPEVPQSAGGNAIKIRERFSEVIDFAHSKGIRILAGYEAVRDQNRPRNPNAASFMRFISRAVVNKNGREEMDVNGECKIHDDLVKAHVNDICDFLYTNPSSALDWDGISFDIEIGALHPRYRSVIRALYQGIAKKHPDKLVTFATFGFTARNQGRNGASISHRFMETQTFDLCEGYSNIIARTMLYEGIVDEPYVEAICNYAFRSKPYGLALQRHQVQQGFQGDPQPNQRKPQWSITDNNEMVSMVNNVLRPQGCGLIYFALFSRAQIDVERMKFFVQLDKKYHVNQKPQLIRNRQLDVETDISRELSYSVHGVLDERISIPAQHSLVRLSKKPDTSEAALGMLKAIKSDQLAGIYCVNWKTSAQRALALGKNWWTAIPKGEDAILMLPPRSQSGAQPLIAFRRELSPDCGLLKREKSLSNSPARLDAAMFKAWKSFLLFRLGKASCVPIQGETFNRFGMNQIDFEEPNTNILSNVLCEPGSTCRRKNGVSNQKCLTSFRNAEAELRKHNWKLPNHTFHTFAFDGMTVLASNGSGFNRFVGHVAASVSPYLGHGQVVFAETANTNIPQLWAIYVPNSLDFGYPVPTHVFFAPNPTSQMTSSPYPYGQEWNRFVDRYLIGKQKRLLQQLKASGKKTLLIFPIARPAIIRGAPIYGLLSNANELRKSLMELLCWLGSRIPQLSTSPELGYCSVSGFSAAGYTLRGIMDSSNTGEFPELAETYFLDIVRTAWSPLSVQRWLSKPSRFGQRYLRVYTSYPSVVNNRPTFFRGQPIRVNAEAKEWQVNNGTLVYVPQPFWDKVFNEHGNSKSPDYDRISAHQIIPCVFLEHALKNSGFPNS